MIRVILLTIYIIGAAGTFCIAWTVYDDGELVSAWDVCKVAVAVVFWFLTWPCVGYRLWKEL